MSKANGLYAIENHVKEMIAEDVNNPEIFFEIKRLALVYLKRYKKMTWGSEAEEVATLIAEDLYLKVSKGTTIYMWIGYIARSCMGYIREFRRMTETEFIDTTGNPVLEEAVVTMSIGGSYDISSGRVLQQLENSESLSIIPNTIVRVMNRSRYREYTSAYCNSHISILLSILNERKTEHNLSESESAYFSYLLADATDSVREVLMDMYNDNKLFSGGSLMAMFSLSQLCTDTSDE